MKATPLETLLSLRLHELQVVERAFADALKRENEAADEVTRAEARIREEQAVAADPEADDSAVEAFSQWLPVGREALEKARQTERQAALDSDLVRSALLMARAAVETVETLHEKRKAEVAALALGQEQKALDEIGMHQSARN